MSSLVLQGVTWDHPRGLDGLVRCARLYAEARGVEVRWTARSLKDFGDAPIEGLAQHHDLLVIDHPHVGWARAAGALAPLDEILSAETLQTLASESAGPSHGSYEFAGRQWALAVDAAMQASSCRPDLLDSVPPRDWPEVCALGRTLRSRGLWMALALVPTDAICLFITLCAGAGDLPGRRNDGRFAGVGAGRTALRSLAELAALSHPESLQWNPIALYDAMAGRDDVAYCPAAFAYTNYSRTGFRRRMVRFGDLPGTRGSCLGGAGLAVSARGTHHRAAADFAAWVCGSETQRTAYVEANGQPGNGVAWRDTRANALTSGFFGSTAATLESAYVRPREAFWPAFQEEAGRLLHAWLRAGAREPADTILARLDDLHVRHASAGLTVST